MKTSLDLVTPCLVFSAVFLCVKGIKAVTAGNEPTHNSSRDRRYVPSSDLSLLNDLIPPAAAHYKQALDTDDARVRDPENVTEREQKRIDKLNSALELRTAQLKELIDLYSGSAQRSIYGGARGAGTWYDNFVLLRDLKYLLADPGSQGHGDGLSRGRQAVRDLWSRYPGKTRRFQQVFTDPTHWALPGTVVTGDDERKIFTPRSPEATKKASCLWCTVDADRVSPKLLQDLGVIDWQEVREKKGAQRLKREDVLSEIKRPDVILRLKLIFDSLDFVELDGSTRIGVIRPAKDEVLNFYERKISDFAGDKITDKKILASALRVPETAIGKMLYFSELRSGVAEQARKERRYLIPVQMKAQVFDSLYSLSRGISHTSSGYRREFAKLAATEAGIESIYHRLMTEWKRDTPREIKDDLKMQLKNLVVVTEPDFVHSENISRSHVHYHLANILRSLEEDRGVTPQAKSKQLEAIKRHVDSRKREATGKDSSRTRDGDAAITAITKWSSHFRLIQSRVAELQSKFLTNRPAFCGKRFSLEEVEGDRNLLRKQMTLTVAPFEQMTARPFLTFASKLREAATELQSACATGSRLNIQNTLVKIDIICRLQEFHLTLEDIAEAAGSERVAFSTLVDIASKLPLLLPEATSLGRNSYKKLCPQYFDLKQKSIQMIERLKVYEARQWGQESKDKVLKKLQKNIKKLAVEEVVKNTKESYRE